MKLLYNDLAMAATLTDSGERSGFPGTNAQHPFLIKRWRSLGCSSEWIKFDAGTLATINADSIAIIQHNLTAGATVTVKANSSDSWASPAVSQVATWSAGIILVTLGSLANYRFWRIEIADASNPYGYIEIGRIVIAAAYVPSVKANAAFTKQIVDTTRISRAPSQQVYSDRGVQMNMLTFNLGVVDDTTRKALETVYATVGMATPFVLVVDETATDKLPPYYGTLQGPPQFSATTAWKWQHAAVQFMEAF